jgi:hypothetical protein
MRWGGSEATRTSNSKAWNISQRTPRKAEGTERLY